MTVREHFGLGIHPGADSVQKETGFVVGVEYEIESIVDTAGFQKSDVWGVGIDIDHSLRNNGKEFKTPPLSYESSLELFECLHKTLKVGKDPFSERTSIHVHVNVRDMELDRVKELILCYALVEPLYFEFVGDVRKNSIFCVPLNYTYLPDVYRKDLPMIHKEWHKYTAFNIKPLEQFGTLEFRHLYGTDDLGVFKTWLTAIRDLFRFVRDNPEFKILTALVEGATPAALAPKIVPTLAKRHSVFALNELMKDTVLDVKLAGGGFFK